MIPLIILIAFIIACSKLSVSISKQKHLVIAGNTTATHYIFLQIALWLYLIPPAIIFIPVRPLNYLIFPVPLIALLFLPAILLSRPMARRLETTGTDVAACAGGIISNAVWLGYAGILYSFVITGFNWVLSTI